MFVQSEQKQINKGHKNDHIKHHVIGLGAIHTSELDRSQIDLSPKRFECERSNAN